MKFLATCLGLFAFTGCGSSGGNIKLNPGKIQAARKVAVVGVCVQKVVGALRGTKDVGIFDGNAAKLLLGPLVSSLNTSLAAQWSGVDVVPLAPSTEPATRPVGEHRLCVNDADPMTPGGYLGTADGAYLGAVATKLGVDAVLVVSGNVNVRLFSGRGAKAYVPSIGSGFELTLVDRAGEEVAAIELKNFETEYYIAAGTKDDGDATKMGESLGKLVAQGFVAAVKGQPFNPPSRPGMSGLSF
jgi:hypothetical protein